MKQLNGKGWNGLISVKEMMQERVELPLQFSLCCSVIYTQIPNPDLSVLPVLGSTDLQ